MGDIAVQHGRNDIGNTGGTQAITDIGALTDAFEWNGNNLFTHGGSVSSGGNMEGDDMSGGVELTATDTLTFTRQSGSLAQNMRYDWSVLEYTGSPGGSAEFIVRSRNTVTLTGASATQALDTTPDNIDRCVPIITGVRTSQTSNQGDELRAIAYINDSGSLVVEKGSTTSTTIVQVVVVEFTGSDWEVYHGTATSSADTGSITLNTDSDGAGGSAGDVTDWADAFIIGQFTSTDQGLDSIAAHYVPGSGTTTVDWTFQSGNSSSHKHFVHVVRHPDMVVTRYSAAGSAAGDTNVSIASAGLSSVAEAMVIGTCEGSGGGTAYGRNWRNYSLTSTTNARHYCHRSGNTINHRMQVVDFAGVASAGGGVTVAIGQASESQNGQSLSSLKVRAVSSVLASMLSRPFGKSKTGSMTAPVASSSARALSRTKQKVAVQASESDALFAFSRGAIPILVGLVAVSNLAQPKTSAKRSHVGVVSTLSESRAVSKGKRAGISSTGDSESASAVAGSSSVGTGQAAETSTATSTGRAKVAIVVLGNESDSGRMVGKASAGALSLVSETDVAQQIGSQSVGSFGQVLGSESSRSVDSAKETGFGRASEVDFALLVESSKTLLIARVTEAELAGVISRTAITVAGTASESDLAGVVGSAKAAQIVRAAESGVPVGLASTKRKSIALANESGTTLTLTAAQAVSVGLLAETELAETVTAVRALDLGQVAEVDVVLDVRPTGSAVIIVTNIVTATATFQLLAERSVQFGKEVAVEAAFRQLLERELVFGKTVDVEAEVASVVERDVEF